MTLTKEEEKALDKYLEDNKIDNLFYKQLILQPYHYNKYFIKQLIIRFYSGPKKFLENNVAGQYL